MDKRSYLALELIRNCKAIGTHPIHGEQADHYATAIGLAHMGMPSRTNTAGRQPLVAAAMAMLDADAQAQLARETADNAAHGGSNW